MPLKAHEEPAHAKVSLKMSDKFSKLLSLKRETRVVESKRVWQASGRRFIGRDTSLLEKWASIHKETILGGGGESGWMDAFYKLINEECSAHSKWARSLSLW